MWLFGWKVVGRKPPHDRYVLVAAPHTSNWDFVFTLGAAWSWDVKLYWMGKHTLFRWPFRGFMRWAGGIPVDRRSSHHMVEQMVEAFEQTPDLVVCIPPQGSRSYRDYWKSGFYYIALGAKVPLVLGVLDYEKKEAEFGSVLWPSGNLKADMEQIRAFYQGRAAKYPSEFGPVRLKDEEPEQPIYVAAGGLK